MYSEIGGILSPAHGAIGYLAVASYAWPSHHVIPVKFNVGSLTRKALDTQDGRQNPVASQGPGSLSASACVFSKF